MNRDDFPAPAGGFVLTHFLVVADQDRSRDFYQRLFDGQVVLERDPVIMKVANSWLILNEGGGPTDDKPTVTLTTPPDANRTSAFLNVRVADIDKVYRQWSARGAEFLTEPKDHGREIRAYVRDPDGHLIEVGQTTGGSLVLETPWVMELDDLPRTEHAHEFVGADHGEVPFSIILVHAPPGAGPRLHRHPYPEVFVVESGEARFQLGDDTLVVRGGQIVVGPANIPHGFANTGTGPLRLTAIHGAAAFDTEWLTEPDPQWASKPER